MPPCSPEAGHGHVWPILTRIKNKGGRRFLEDGRRLDRFEMFEPFWTMTAIWFAFRLVWEHIQVKVFGLWLHQTFIVGHPDTSHANRSTWGTPIYPIYAYSMPKYDMMYTTPFIASRSSRSSRHRLLIQDVSPCDLCLGIEVLRSAQVRANFLQSVLTTLRCPVHMGAELPFYFLFISKSRAYAL